jgi:hypothetical protein
MFHQLGLAVPDIHPLRNLAYQYRRVWLSGIKMSEPLLVRIKQRESVAHVPRYQVSPEFLQEGIRDRVGTFVARCGYHSQIIASLGIAGIAMIADIARDREHIQGLGFVYGTAGREPCLLVR